LYEILYFTRGSSKHLLEVSPVVFDYYQQRNWSIPIISNSFKSSSSYFYCAIKKKFYDVNIRLQTDRQSAEISDFPPMENALKNIQFNQMEIYWMIDICNFKTQWKWTQQKYFHSRGHFIVVPYHKKIWCTQTQNISCRTCTSAGRMMNINVHLDRLG